jgi:CHAD domain-containing protein
VLARTDIEFLHDLRVALRRTRSVLSQAATVIDPDDRAELAAGFRWFTAATSSPRDLDVLALDWPQRVAATSAAARRALEPVRRQLLADRDAAHARLAATMGSDEVRDLFGAYDEFLADPTHRGTASLGPDARTPLGRLVAGQVQAAHRRVVRDGRAIDAGSHPERLHDLRKDTKKLRYRIECFAGLLPPGATSPFIKRLKGLQDVLGRYQDAQVHADELRLAVRELQALGGLDPRAVSAADEIVAGLERSSAEARDEFGERFATFDGAATRRELDRLIDALQP